MCVNSPFSVIMSLLILPIFYTFLPKEPLAFHWAKHFCHCPFCNCVFLASWSHSSCRWLLYLSASFPCWDLDLCLLDYGPIDPDWPLADVLMSACSLSAVTMALLYKEHFHWMTFKVPAFDSHEWFTCFFRSIFAVFLLPAQENVVCMKTFL